MSKINPLSSSNDRTAETRLAGGFGNKAAKQNSISSLRRLVLANLLWEDNAYVDGVTVSTQISELIPLCKPEDVANLAVEARVVQKLRHTPLFMCVEMLKHEDTKHYVKDILPKIITRADMLTDMLALYWKLNTAPKGKKHAPLANALKDGLAKSFDNFNEYQLAKYDRNAAIKLRDVMFLTNPKPPKGKEELYKAIADRTLKTPDTWEVALSTGKNKTETWTRLIEEGKIGGLAMLRNIRNMKDALVDKSVIVEGLKRLKSSMLLPLNFLTSARMNPEFEREIEDAMMSSYENLTKLPGRTLVIIDRSGSMAYSVSSKSGLSRLDAAMALCMLAVNRCENYEIVMTAGSDRNPRGHEGNHIHIPYPKKGFSLFEQCKTACIKLGGWGIFTRQCLEWCYDNVGTEFDRIIVISDSQDQDRLSKIPKPYGKSNYIVDVSSHQHGINYRGVWTAELSGFSEHFLTYIAAIEGLENQFDTDNE